MVQTAPKSNARIRPSAGLDGCFEPGCKTRFDGQSGHLGYPLFNIDMNPNSIRAHLAFSYKGEIYQLDSIIDLDSDFANGEPPNFHQLLARAANIDPYSYLYEVLESHPIAFSEPSGVAALSCRDGEFDWLQFQQYRREGGEIQAVREIAERMLGVRDLDQDASLKAALLAAYQAGKGR